MCRFLAYMGKPVLMHDLIFKPKNSLINQSIRANDTDQPLNGDGFGVGWYAPEIDRSPALFVSVRPAWNEMNLLYIAPKIVSPCIFAHVRAASLGVVNELNCHPFHFKNFLFMHNGDIEDFEKIERHLEQELSNDIYQMIGGQTDSEHLFALFLERLDMRKSEFTAGDIADALEKSVSGIRALKRRHNISAPDYINVCVTDGNSTVALRYISDESLAAPTLYYSEGSAYECHEGECRMRPSEEDQAVLIVSERLTSYRSDWHEIPVNHILLVEQSLRTVLKPCSITPE